MANINKELNKIKNAVYGREVRQAIHDSIKKTYDDAAENGNANMEVVMARGTENTLGNRLDKMHNKQNDLTSQLNETNSQLAQKANDNDVRKKDVLIGLNDADSGLLTAIQGGTEVNVLSIPKTQSVSPDKTTFIYTENLFNKETVVPEYMVSLTDGKLIQSPLTMDFIVSDFIPVTKGDYALTQTRNVAVYDEEKKFIVGLDGNKTIVNVEQDGFLRITTYKSRRDAMMVVEGNVLPSEYKKFGYRMKDIIVEAKNIVHSDKKVSIHFGDSITASSGIPEKIAELTGYETINFGIGSTRLTTVSNPGTSGYGHLQFLDLINAKITGDWTHVDEGVSLTGNSVIADKINKLKALDMSTVDYLSFMYGTNDINSATLYLSTPESTNTNTINGAMNVALETIYANWPHIRVFVFAPIFRPEMPDSGEPKKNSDEFSKTADVYLYDIANTMGERAKTFKTPFKNMYFESGINKYNWRYYIDDGTHPNVEKGGAMLAEVMSRFILSH